jgi:hypothetical protein
MISSPSIRKRGLRPRPAPVARPLQVETLEDRCLMTVQVLATLGTPAPGPGSPGFLINDFEPGGLNNKGDVIYGADIGTANDPSTFFGEAIYLRDVHGNTTRLAGSADPAPGTSTTFNGQGFFGPVTLNDSGDAALAFQLSPFMLPFGTDGGLFRYSHTTNQVTPVVVPFVTPAPTGGTFHGAFFGYTLANNGDLAFDGLISTANGIHAPNETYIGVGEGIFLANAAGNIRSVVVPGDAAPGGSTFDWAAGPWLNQSGDMAFEGHVAGEPLLGPDSALYIPQAIEIGGPNNVYFRDGATGKITLIAHAGDSLPTPAGPVTVVSAYDAMINNAGDIIFTGATSDGNPADDGKVDALFRYSKGTTSAIAYPGESMPGGGHLVTISGITGSQKHINNQGDITFNATLDTTTDGVPDQGLYLWSKGQTTLIARSGTVLPGVGTIAALTSPSNIIVGPSPGVSPTGGAYMNDRDQVFFACTLTDGSEVLLLATPTNGPDSWIVAVKHHAPVAAAGAQALPGQELAWLLQGPHAGLFAASGSGAAGKDNQGNGPSPQALTAVAQKLAAWEQAQAASNQAPTQGDVDAFFVLWGDVLSAAGLYGSQS